MSWITKFLKGAGVLPDHSTMAIDAWQRNRPGRSAEKQFTSLRRAWRRRRIGRKFTVYFAVVYTLLFVLAKASHPGGDVALYIGFALGAIAGTWWLLPELLMPAQILRWQQGAWGEQKTASELDRFDRTQWAVRHDVAWGKTANHDHVVAGRSAYVLNTKNVPDSTVAIEANALRVSLIDSPEASYLADRWVPGVQREAEALKKTLEKEVGFPVWVNPVIVIWGMFPKAEVMWMGDVAVVHGLHVVDWIAARPTDLPNPKKQAQVMRAVMSLPSATRNRAKEPAEASFPRWRPGWR